MIILSKYIPRILLCGDADNFLPENPAQIEIVGQIDFVDEKIFLDDAEISGDELRKILDDAADYLLFDDSAKLVAHFDDFAPEVNEKFITRDALLKYAGNNFFSPTNAETLMNFIREQKISGLLDADNFFARNDFFYADGIEVDGLNVDTKNFPFAANFYGKIFSSLDDCYLQTYDAILFTADRDADEIFDALIATDGMSENIFVFVRKNSALESWLAENSVAFAEIVSRPAVNGAWVFLRKRVPPENFCIYVPAPAENLPDGYKIVHADDDAGENICELNRYLGDLTAFYWLWKNTRNTVIGFASDEFLSRDAAENFLRDCDLIVAQGKFSKLTNHEQTIKSGEYLTAHVEKIFRKHINRTQPDYLSAFDYVGRSYFAFPHNFFVTRRKIFDAYCTWLFSFLLDVTEEVLATTNLAAVSNPQKFRVVELTARRLPTVWLLKNSLRLKEVS